MREDRGYDPDIGDVEKQRLQQIILKLIERSGYIESQGGEKTWRDWILGIIGILVTVGIPSAIYQLQTIATSIATLTANQRADHDQVLRIQERLDRVTP